MPLVLAVTPLPPIRSTPRFVFAVCGNLQSSVLNGTQAEDNFIYVTGGQIDRNHRGRNEDRCEAGHVTPCGQVKTIASGADRARLGSEVERCPNMERYASLSYQGCEEKDPLKLVFANVIEIDYNLTIDNKNDFAVQLTPEVVSDLLKGY